MQIKKTEFTTEGRKVPLADIRQQMFERHAPYMRIRTDDEYDKMSEQELNLRLAELHESDDNLSLEERRAKLKSLERTRNFIVWHDNSTVANHGFLVCMIGCLYDPAVFYTNDEYLVKTGKHTDVQKVIEKPEVNFLARCGSSDQEQMLYTETRLECIQGLKENLTTEELLKQDNKRGEITTAPLVVYMQLWGIALTIF